MCHIVEQISDFQKSNSHGVWTLTVSKHDYEQWARGFVFEGLRNQRYGQSFCNHFNIKDNILYYVGSVEEADAYIQKNYIR